MKKDHLEQLDIEVILERKVLEAHQDSLDQEEYLDKKEERVKLTQLFNTFWFKEIVCCR